MTYNQAIAFLREHELSGHPEVGLPLRAIKEYVATFHSDLPGLHRRKCWGCGKEHWHAQDRTPGVLCPECGSQDTRKIR